MISKEHLEALARMKDTAYGTALRAFCDDEKDKLQDLTTLTTLEDGLARKYTLMFIKKLLTAVNGKDEQREKTGSSYE